MMWSDGGARQTYARRVIRCEVAWSPTYQATLSESDEVTTTDASRVVGSISGSRRSREREGEGVENRDSLSANRDS